MKDAMPILCRLVVLVGFFVAPVHAQTTGTCAPAEAEAYLDVNNVRARIFNNGALFWKGQPYVYEVPKGSGVNAIFNASFWIGGLHGVQRRVASPRYGNWEFWPGPLDDDGHPPHRCTFFDRIYKITRNDIERYYETGIFTPDLFEWPHNLGAPVLDGDGDPDNYNLEKGDQPALVGDQMLWWIMNDVGNEHKTSGSPPIGMEVQGTAFAFNRDPRSPFTNTTFYRYRLHYKGQRPLEQTYVALFVDTDLGNFDDDWVGADTTLAMGFVYNGDNDDEGPYGYGLNPPALGVVLIQGPLIAADGRDNDRDGLVDEPGERLMMTAFTTAHVEVHERSSSNQAYNSMRGLTPFGKPINEGGLLGYGHQNRTTIMLAGDPVTAQFWSEPNWDGKGTPTTPSDRTMLISSGPFTMQPGETQEIIFAMVWSQGDDHLDAVRQLKKDVARIRDGAEQVLQPTSVPMPGLPLEPVFPLGFAQNYPNPFSTYTIIRYGLPQSMYVRLRVFDVLGREVAMLVDGQQQGGIYEASFVTRDLPAGVYFYRIEMDHLRFSKRMMLVR